MTDSPGLNQDARRYGGPTRYKVAGAVYVPSITPRGMPAFLSYEGGGLLEALASTAMEAAIPERFGFTLQVRRYRGLNMYRSVLRKHYTTRAEAETAYKRVVDDLKHSRLDVLQE